MKKNVLADDDDDDENTAMPDARERAKSSLGKEVDIDAESDTDEEYGANHDYYDPRKPTDCPASCPGLNAVIVS